MKKIDVVNLIKYHADKNELAFRQASIEIANYFNDNGDEQLAQYIMAILTNNNSLVPQINQNELLYLQKVLFNSEPLPIPESIQKDILGIVNAIGHNAGVNKYMFYGMPGTGKTETVKQISRILSRDLYMVNFSAIVDSKLGQTQKNIVELFDEINNFSQPEKLLILFDEIDALALDRSDSKDIREMGRATSTLLNSLDTLDGRIVLIATTNLYSLFDKAILRRFDAKISFDRYSLDDLVEISVELFNFFATKFNFVGKNIRLLKKIIYLMNPILSPGELKNAIKSSIAFSNSSDQFDYLKRLYVLLAHKELDLKYLQSEGFTVREIEILTGISKSTVARQLKD